jgi:hypothetical protein
MSRRVWDCVRAGNNNSHTTYRNNSCIVAVKLESTTWVHIIDLLLQQRQRRIVPWLRRQTNELDHASDEPIPEVFAQPTREVSHSRLDSSALTVLGGTR